MSDVTTKHPDYLAAQPRVRLVRDFSKGDFAVKAGTVEYLPAFVPDDKERYAKYLMRAYVLGLTGRTKESLVGMIFRKAAEYVIPNAMTKIIENVDGAGQSVEQLAKQAAGELMEAGRYALLVDYPQAGEGIDKETETKLGLQPTVASYRFESLINWKHDVINGRRMLTMAVLEESRPVDTDDEFSHDCEPVYRALRLRDGVYTQQMYNDKSEPISDEYAPLMAGKKPFDHIPLHIIGSQNNLPDVDVAPLYQLAILNRAHYQTTADHRENLFIHGQLTLGISSKQTWEEFELANPNGVQVGARTGHFLGEGGSFSVATAPESSSLRVALSDLELQAVSIGAQLITRGGQAETAEAARINAGAEASALDTLTNNLSEGIEAALEDVARFMGVDPDAIEYSLNTSFWEAQLSGQDLQAVMAARMQGLIGATDALQMIRNGRIQLSPERDNETILEEVANDLYNEPVPTELVQ